MEPPPLEDMDDPGMEALDVEDASGGMLPDEQTMDGDPWVRCAQHQTERPPDNRHEVKELCNRCRDARSRAAANDLKLILKKATSLYPRTGRHVAVVQFEAKRGKMRIVGSPLARASLTHIMSNIQSAWRSALAGNLNCDSRAPGASIPPPTRHNGARISKLSDLSLADLRVYIPQLIRAAEDRSKPGYSKMEMRPAWWDREWSQHCVHSDLNREDLLHLVRNCYRHYNRLDLLSDYQGQEDTVAPDPSGLYAAVAPSHSHVVSDPHGLCTLAPLPASVDVMDIPSKSMAIPPELSDDDGPVSKRARGVPDMDM